MTSVPPIKRVDAALKKLREDYSELLEDIAKGERVLWIGAGISRGQVPDVEQLIRAVLEYLLKRISDDPHKQALEHILSEHLPGEAAVFGRDPDSWTVPDDLSNLTTSYSSILGAEVGDKEQDYLLWEAVDVRNTYGNPIIQPGPEHWLIAFLSHEGLVQEAVTTNWDGLIERAVKDSALDPDKEHIAVFMTEESFRSERAPFKLYKAHGCAVLAREDETYRSYLVSQTYDINTWRDNPIFRSLVGKLRDLAKTRESLMIGTSVQDHNLLGRIAAATQELRWPWTPKDPACVFAEPQVSVTQLDALRLVYRDDYARHREQIRQISAAGMYSGPLLAGVTLHVVFEKFRIGVSQWASPYGQTATVLDDGLNYLEDQIAFEAGEDIKHLVSLLRLGVSAFVQRYFEPTKDLEPLKYKAVYENPIKGGPDTSFIHLGLPELAAALALLGQGAIQGFWQVGLSTGSDETPPGVLSLTSSHPGTDSLLRVVVTRDWTETSALKSTDLWVKDDADTVVLQACGEPDVPAARTSAGGLGSGRRQPGPPLRRVCWLSPLRSHSGDSHELISRFREGVLT